MRIHFQQCNKNASSDVRPYGVAYILYMEWSQQMGTWTFNTNIPVVHDTVSHQNRIFSNTIVRSSNLHPDAGSFLGAGPDQNYLWRHQGQEIYFLCNAMGQAAGNWLRAWRRSTNLYVKTYMKMTCFYTTWHKCQNCNPMGGVRGCPLVTKAGGSVSHTWIIKVTRLKAGIFYD